jgi:DNA-directed RNA polymerase specialized sigma54-like protein
VHDEQPETRAAGGAAGGEERLERLLDHLRRHAAPVVADLEPRPGRDYVSEEPRYIVPDVYVSKVGESYVTLEVAQRGEVGIEMQMQKSAIQTLLPKGTMKAI